MKRKQLSRRDVEEINAKIAEYGLAIDKKDFVELVEDDYRIIFVNRESAYFYLSDRLIPTLKSVLKSVFLKKVVVDMGAVKFVTSGADVMRPGIRAVDEGIAKDEVVVIVDEKNLKPLAIGMANMSGSDIMAATSGKVVRNLHWAGDKIWGFS